MSKAAIWKVNYFFKKGRATQVHGHVAEYSTSVLILGMKTLPAESPQ